LWGEVLEITDLPPSRLLWRSDQWPWGKVERAANLQQGEKGVLIVEVDQPAAVIGEALSTEAVATFDKGQSARSAQEGLMASRRVPRWWRR